MKKEAIYKLIAELVITVIFLSLFLKINDIVVAFIFLPFIICMSSDVVKNIFCKPAYRY